MNEKDEEQLLTTDDVAQRYRIDKRTQKLYRDDGTWPYIKPTKRIYYRKEMIEKWINDQFKLAGVER